MILVCHQGICRERIFKNVACHNLKPFNFLLVTK